MSDADEPTHRPPDLRATQLRGGFGARRGDHPQARLGRGLAERDARAGQRGQVADRAVRQRARGRRRRARGAAAGRARQPAGSGGRASEHLGAAGRPAAAVDGYSLEGLKEIVSSGFERNSTTDPPARRRPSRASARTSPTTRSTRRSCRPRERPSRSPGDHTIASFCELIGELELFPEPPQREVSRALSQLGVSVGRAGPGPAPGRHRPCTGRSAATLRPVRFVVSLRLGEPPSMEPLLQPARPLSRACASSSTRRARGTTR